MLTTVNQRQSDYHEADQASPDWPCEPPDSLHWQGSLSSGTLLLHIRIGADPNEKHQDSNEDCDELW